MLQLIDTWSDMVLKSMYGICSLSASACVLSWRAVFQLTVLGVLSSSSCAPLSSQKDFMRAR